MTYNFKRNRGAVDVNAGESPNSFLSLLHVAVLNYTKKISITPIKRTNYSPMTRVPLVDVCVDDSVSTQTAIVFEILKPQ